MVRRKKRARRSPETPSPLAPEPLRRSLRGVLKEHLGRRAEIPPPAPTEPYVVGPLPELPRAASPPQPPSEHQERPAPDRSRAEIPPPPPDEPSLLERLLGDVVPLRGPARVALTPAANSNQTPFTIVERAARALPRFVVERGYDEVWGYRVDAGAHAIDPLWSPRWAPQKKIDLHRQTVRSLVPLLTTELRALARRGVTRLLLIHGKGRHSHGGVGVLADAVVEVLTEGAPAVHVKAFRTAPAHLGGRGALAVELDVDLP